MRTLLKAASASLAALALSVVAATAATVASGPGVGIGASPPPVAFDAGDNVVFTDFFGPGETSVAFTFTANQAAKITGFAVNGVGLVSDLAIISFDLDNGGSGTSTFTITPFAPTGITGFGGGFKDDFSMAAGETVSLIFTLPASGTSLVSLASVNSIGAFFQTAPVPLPAALPMLALALGGLAVARRKAA